MEKQKYPCWRYHQDGRAEVLTSEAGEASHEGWAESPAGPWPEPPEPPTSDVPDPEPTPMRRKGGGR